MLSSINGGDDNAFLGYQAGNSLNSGIQNTFIGSKAGFSGINNLTSGNNNTIIGYNSQASSATVSNEVTLGNTLVQTLRCATSKIATVSDRRDKTDILDSKYGLEFIEKVRPRTFKWDRRELVEGDKNHFKNGKSEDRRQRKNFKMLKRVIMNC